MLASDIGFVVHGYVVMPEHFHLLITEPEVRDPSVVMKVVKERFSRVLHKGTSEDFPVWQKRFYDFNVWSERKRIEKLRYMHRNPVKRGLVESPEKWMWSSFQWCWMGEVGIVAVHSQEWPLKIRRIPGTKFDTVVAHPFAKSANEWGTRPRSLVKNPRPRMRARGCYLLL